MEKKNTIDTLVELAVWAHLDSKTDLELILLKGHLLLETILEIILKRNNLTDCENFSFYRKIIALESLNLEDQSKKDLMILALKDINRLRNMLSHEFSFEIRNGDIEKWALNVFNNLEGKKFTKYTFRTKIVHSFSILSKNLIELKVMSNN